MQTTTTTTKKFNHNSTLVYHLFIGVTILLSLTVFLNLVAETLPQVSDAIPLLGREKKNQKLHNNFCHIYIFCISYLSDFL